MVGDTLGPSISDVVGARDTVGLGEGLCVTGAAVGDGVGYIEGFCDSVGALLGAGEMLGAGVYTRLETFLMTLFHRSAT
jgi:hypothetical protein